MVDEAGFDFHFPFAVHSLFEADRFVGRADGARVAVEEEARVFGLQRFRLLALEGGDEGEHGVAAGVDLVQRFFECGDERFVRVGEAAAQEFVAERFLEWRGHDWSNDGGCGFISKTRRASFFLSATFH